MYGGLNQDSFGATWAPTEFDHLEHSDGGFFEEDLSNFITEDDINKPNTEVNLRKTFMPLKINMIYSSWKTGGVSINVYGYQLDIIKLIGYVKEAKETDQDTSFLIDDGTGTIECIHLSPGDISDWKRNYISELTRTKSAVKIYGGFNPLYSSSSPTIIIYSIKEVTSPEEIKLHNLDVIYSVLLIDGKRNPNVMDTIGEMDAILKEFDISIPKQQQDNSLDNILSTTTDYSPTSTAKMPVNELALTKFISSMLANESRNNNYNGLHITEISRRCRQQHSFQSVQEQNIRKILKDLERDATVFQTLDSNTYASTDS